jgi:hypothetical protein
MSLIDFAKIWSNLLHPHILREPACSFPHPKRVPDDHVEFLGANVLDDTPFIVMPLLKNGNARDYIHVNPGCNRQKIVSIIADSETTCH